MRGRNYTVLIEIPVLLALMGLFYLFLKVMMVWQAPPQAAFRIDLSVRHLPFYALLSVTRILLAYVLSLVFSVSYGYLAAHNRTAEKIMIPILDVLQSIPVLSFLPGVMIAVTSLFPNHQFGVELASIVLIFTGQVWNIAFGFYLSLKTIPNTLLETAKALNLTRWQRFVYLEFPFAVPSLVWNSMLGVAGGWFFLMACEMFVLGNRDFRLLGIGSYLQTAASRGDLPAIFYGIATMVIVIVLMDLLLWKPLVAYADKFKFEETSGAESHESFVLQLLIRSKILGVIKEGFARLTNAIADALPERKPVKREPVLNPRIVSKLFYVVFAVVLAAFGYYIVENLYRVGASGLVMLLKYDGFSFSRVIVSIGIACAWAVPVGVAIGMRPKLTKILQPVIQVAASVPATALFPVILMVIIQYGGGLETGAIFLMLFGTQWYILFNVIAGANAIPRTYREVAKSYNLSGIYQWRYFILPSIFPYLLSGLITAWGGAWNATIVAEYTRFGGKILSIPGLGSLITKATNEGNLTLLISATAVMAITVMLFNKFVWKRLYMMAEEKFKLG